MSSSTIAVRSMTCCSAASMNCQANAHLEWVRMYGPGGPRSPPERARRPGDKDVSLGRRMGTRARSLEWDYSLAIACRMSSFAARRAGRQPASTPTIAADDQHDDELTERDRVRRREVLRVARRHLEDAPPEEEPEEDAADRAEHRDDHRLPAHHRPHLTARLPDRAQQARARGCVRTPRATACSRCRTGR